MELLCIEYESEPRGYLDPVFIDDDRILKNLLQTEERYMITCSYFKCFQTELQEYMRKQVCSWMYEVSFIFHLFFGKKFWNFWLPGSGLWGRNVPGRSISTLNEHHGQVLVRRSYSKKSIATIGYRLSILGIQDSPDSTSLRTEVGILHRLFNNMRGTRGKWLIQCLLCTLILSIPEWKNEWNARIPGKGRWCTRGSLEGQSPTGWSFFLNSFREKRENRKT